MLNTASDNIDLPRFFTKKWIEVLDQSGENYSVNKEMRIKTPMLRADLCDFSDAYIVIKGVITVTNPNDVIRNKSVASKNNATFINCISKINNVLIDNAEDVDAVMHLHNLTEYRKNYTRTRVRLQNYYRDETSNPLSANSESSKYKTSIRGNTYNLGAGDDGYDANKVGKNETEIFVLLKHLSNFGKL